ncbi:hypothetical protein ACFQ44_10565 [Levilactobacillus lanxiensis]|uniref:EamA domain-containing protein n=1 Tax=Levilactobacillus lanxiensis TaxID=2799568 RepID=A0ABW4D3M5_9LACO|nr:hypothetical protein [Levilactobacillus lanxiensis]
MLPIVAEYAILIFSILLGIATLANFKAYVSGNSWLKVSGALNLLSPLLIAVFLFLGTSTEIKIAVTCAAIILIGAAIMHGIAINNFHLKHHIIRITIFCLMLLLVWV